jgi:hypothetical protein
MRSRIFTVCSALLFVLLGLAAAIALLSGAGMLFLAWSTWMWWVLCLILLMGALTALYFSRTIEPVSAEERILEEMRLAMRGHLKLSILFWILAYRKEKMKSFDDSKKEIFQEVKKNLPSDPWTLAMLDEIYADIARSLPK